MNAKPRLPLALFACLLLFACSGGGGEETETGGTDGADTGETSGPVDYRAEMRNFVQGISALGRARRPGFIVIPQNGHELLSLYADPAGETAHDYVAAIDGVGREDLFYGYYNDDEATPAGVTAEIMLPYMYKARVQGLQVLAIDYCSTPSKVDDSYAKNAARGFISFAADHRDLDNVPAYPAQPYNVNSDDIADLNAAQNFLYIINPTFGEKTEFLNYVSATDYDVVLIDLFFAGTTPLTADDVAVLKRKAHGGARLVVAYMSIGEAEDYRWYWKPEWAADPPSFLDAENPDWPGNYKVRYWDPEWRKIIYYGEDGAYLQKILDAGFDGVYLDIIDAYEYYENL